MRVIAGTYRGQRLKAPPGRDIRPTADRVREALFSILGSLVVDADVLDLFAGTGALGIEALSRGARAAVFVDTDTRAVTANLGGIEGAETVRSDARAYLRSVSMTPRQYDLVLLDPPYQQGQQLGIELSALVAAVLAPGGTVVCESDRRTPLDLPDLTPTDERRYGKTLIRLYEH
jgi:16S rRNA (guanine(966)-N(2))-methyltransferase RsmD